MEEDKQCLLVIMGATPEGKKELVGFTNGYRESTQSWRELLFDLKAKGLCVPPKLAVGDGAMGFWGALDQVFPTTRQQRCWLHKTFNILDKLPKSLQSKAKADVHNIWMAETKEEAGKAFGVPMIIRGSLERLTPVLMTALVSAFALIPLLIGADQPGKEILHPVSTVIFGGLISSTLLDTILTPILFWKYGKMSLLA